jgi:uncharacterized protein (DUF2164 family)
MMKPIEFTKDAKAALIARIQHHFDEELDQPIGLLKAELVLEFFAKEVGAAYYRRGSTMRRRRWRGGSTIFPTTSISCNAMRPTEQTSDQPPVRW